MSLRVPPLANDGRPAARAPHRWQHILVACRTSLPRGGALSGENWSARHKGICILLWSHAVALPLIAVVGHQTVGQALIEAMIVAVFATGALLSGLSPQARAALATLGLFSSSAILVHIFDGVTELHFHFFVMVAVIALYQSWTPLLLAVGFVVVHHGVVGMVATSSVTGSYSSMDKPWLWTLIHGGFILAESLVCMVYWRVTEDALDGERAAWAQLEKAHGELAQAQELSALGSWDWDITTNTVTWSDQLYALSGVNPTTFTPTTDSFLDLVHPDDHDRVATLIGAAFNARTGLDYEYRMVRPDGTVRTMQALGEWTTNTQGSATRMFGTVHDVTERRLLQAEIEHLAFHDPLTGLANRRLFMDRLGHALAVTERSGRTCAVLFMDLDGFKKINDTFGHGAGDDLLCEVARRLVGAARGVDTLARLGGDEFALLCEGIDLETANRVAARINEHFQRPLQIHGTEICLGLSIGVAFAEGSLSTEDILRDADAAMYTVKSAGKALALSLAPGGSPT